MKRVAEVPLEVLELAGYRYTTLDFCPPGASTFLNKSNNYQLLHAGWELAPPSAELRAEVVRHTWGGASWMILSDGSAYSLKDGIADIPKSNHLATVSRGCLDIEKAKSGLYKCRTFGREGFARILVRVRVGEESASNAASQADEMMSQIFKKRRFTDFVLSCEGQDFACHRAILAEASPVFDAALSSNMVEAQQHRLEILDAEPAVVEAMLAFIYSSEIKQGGGAGVDLVKLIVLGDRYGLDKMVARCSQPLLEKLDEHRVVPVARALKNGSDKPVLSACFQNLQAKIAESPALLKAVLQSM